MIKQRNVTSLLRQGMAVIIFLLGVMTQQVNAARVEVAGELLVDLRSEDLASGSASEWPNRGSLGGVFTAGGNPVVESVGDWENVVSLDGASYFEGPVSPSGIVGNGTRSIEVWAYNIGESKEECMVSWSHRGGPNGTNMNFNYGWKDFGAVGHWGDDADMAWEGFNNATGGTGGYPPLENWWYLVYTYDGATIRLYVNGELNNERTVRINTHGGNNIRIGCQNNSDNSPMLGEKAYTGAIAQVRIHDGALTPEQIQNNAQIRIQTFGEASNPSPKNGDQDVPLRDLILSWEPGEYPGSHTVYFSEDMNAVESGTAEAVSDIDVNSYDPGPLNYETTYYWRVDEVNAPPDLTVFKGDIWSFTVESFSYPIPADNITTTASSQAEGQGPENTVDCSGLVDDLHSTVLTDMWLSQPSEPGSAWIQYEFDKTYKLNEMLVWNYNEASSLTGLGLKDITVEYSTDGVNWILNNSVSVFNRAPGAHDYAANTTVPFGDVPVKYVKITANSNWSDGFVNQYGLSEVRFQYIPVNAIMPVPNDGAADIALDTTLGWRAGREAVEHKVYFSDDEQSVIDGTVPAETVQDTIYGPLSLNLGSVYYWRVDEVNNVNAVPIWEGDIWSFSTQEYIVVDDFEDYNDFPPNEIWNTWIDGYNVATNGATAGYPDPDFNAGDHYVEIAIVHGGSQSMPLFYDNTGGVNNSEASRTFGTARDWTRIGINTLTLYVYGDADNVGGQLYLKVNGVEKAADVDFTAESWQEVNIELASFGVNLQSVTSLAISIQGSGSGMVFIDDIRVGAPLE